MSRRDPGREAPPARLRDLPQAGPSGADPGQPDRALGALFKAAAPPPRTGAASRALTRRRIVETLRRDPWWRRPGGRLALPWPALAVALVFLSGGIVGATLQTLRGPRPDPAPDRGAAPGAAPRPAVRPPPGQGRAAPSADLLAAAEPPRPLASSAAAPPDPPIAAARPAPRAAAPAGRPSAPRRAPLPAPAAPVAPPPAAAPAVAPPPAEPLPPAPLPEHALVGEAMRRLYRDRDAAGALEVLEAHARRGRGALGPEAWATKVDALVALGRKGEALALLDRAPLAALPRPRERRALRGELRAGAGRCADALADFEVVAGAGPADAALERALFGRAACRGQAGDRAGARADLERLLALFPAGRFAGAAARALGGPGR